MTAMDRARGLLLGGGLLVAVTVATGTAWAASITCTADGKCFGTSGADVLEGTLGQHLIFGMGGDDSLIDGGGSDLLAGGGGSDWIAAEAD